MEREEKKEKKNSGLKIYPTPLLLQHGTFVIGNPFKHELCRTGLNNFEWTECGAVLVV